MEFTGFEDRDFAVFAVPGLEARMDELKSQLRPKLEQLGRDFALFLSKRWHDPTYAHVARHARRTVNPPNDSWVAFCTDKRGYKRHPHFQIGLWETHAFATFGLIYESPSRAHFAAQLQAHAADVTAVVPTDGVYIKNHMNPAAIPASEVDEARLYELAERLKGRQGELLVGIKIERAEAIRMSAEAFEDRVKDCFESVLPLARLAETEVTAV